MVSAMSSSGLTRTSIVAAGTCLISGLIYTIVAGPVVSNPGPPGALVLAAAIIGGILLAVAGKLQAAAAEGMRVLPLLMLTGLAGGYALANVGAITLTELGAWRAPFFIGLAAGAALFAGALALLADQRSAQHL
jgi:hypothetical protein